MSWEEYLTYLSSRWANRFTLKAAQAEDGQLEMEEKEPLLQWWFGLIPFSVKMAFNGRLRRFPR